MTEDQVMALIGLERLGRGLTEVRVEVQNLK